jgi:hypothetical protein
VEGVQNFPVIIENSPSLSAQIPSLVNTLMSGRRREHGKF